jgi:hypothetical protein
MNVYRQQQIQRHTDTHSDGILRLEEHSHPNYCSLLVEIKPISEVILHSSYAGNSFKCSSYKQMNLPGQYEKSDCPLPERPKWLLTAGIFKGEMHT